MSWTRKINSRNLGPYAQDSTEDLGQERFGPIDLLRMPKAMALLGTKKSLKDDHGKSLESFTALNRC